MEMQLGGVGFVSSPSAAGARRQQGSTGVDGRCIPLGEGSITRGSYWVTAQGHSGPYRQLRSIMNDDIGDGGLIDVSGVSLSELHDELDESALDHALRQILASSDERERHNFQAII